MKNVLKLLTAVLVGVAIGVLGTINNTSADNGQLRQTPVQQYNSVCLILGNYRPCDLAR